MKEPDALCGAPGRDEDADMDVTRDLAPRGPLEWPDPESAATLCILAEYLPKLPKGIPA
ncbi:hypothetical protein WKI65_43235 [Streptomyces sp. MS1.AVA.3]|uniref:hypothetical protein n=1 Tax=Streptomyces decoyicus TaxID=249567 RepID=UPI0030BC26C9